MGQIKALISDFDGTLVDTFEANFRAYQKVFKTYFDINMSHVFYQKYFGLRIDDLCKKLNIDECEISRVKKLKSEEYPLQFSYLKINTYLLNILTYAKQQGIKVALASTASKKNIYNVLKYFNLENFFDAIICGEDVIKGKPDPEVYNVAMNKLDVTADESLIFEDSEVGMQAAENANINYIKIKI